MGEQKQPTKSALPTVATLPKTAIPVSLPTESILVVGRPLLPINDTTKHSQLPGVYSRRHHYFCEGEVQPVQALGNDQGVLRQRTYYYFRHEVATTPRSYYCCAEFCGVVGHSGLHGQRPDGAGG